MAEENRSNTVRNALEAVIAFISKSAVGDELRKSTNNASVVAMASNEQTAIVLARILDGVCKKIEADSQAAYSAQDMDPKRLSDPARKPFLSISVARIGADNDFYDPATPLSTEDVHCYHFKPRDRAPNAVAINFRVNSKDAANEFADTLKEFIDNPRHAEFIVSLATTEEHALLENPLRTEKHNAQNLDPGLPPRRPERTAKEILDEARKTKVARADAASRQ